MRLLKDFLLSFKEIALDYLKSRVFPVTLILIVLFIALINRLFTLQIEQGEQFSESFEVKSEKTLTVNSIRGNIYDVNGNLLAYNNISYTLTFGNDTILPEEAKKKNLSDNKLKNMIIYNTINILQNNGDKIDADFRIKFENGKYSYKVEGQVLRNFLKDVYAADTVDDLTEEQSEATA